MTCGDVESNPGPRSHSRSRSPRRYRHRSPSRSRSPRRYEREARRHDVQSDRHHRSRRHTSDRHGRRRRSAECRSPARASSQRQLQSVWASSNAPHSDIWFVSERSQNPESQRRAVWTGNCAAPLVAAPAVSHPTDIWAAGPRSQQAWSKRARRTPEQLRFQRLARSQSHARRRGSGRGDGRGPVSGRSGHWVDHRRKAGRNRQHNYAPQRQWNMQQFERGRERERDCPEEKLGDTPPKSSSEGRSEMLKRLVQSMPNAPLTAQTAAVNPLQGLLDFAADVSSTQKMMITMLSQHTPVTTVVTPPSE